MRGPRDHTSPGISNHFSLFGCLHGDSVERVDPGRRSKIFQLASGAVFRVIFSLWLSARLLGGTHRPGTEKQNLSESIGGVVFVYGDLCASGPVFLSHLSLLGSLRGGSGEWGPRDHKPPEISKFLSLWLSAQRRSVDVSIDPDRK